MLQPMFQSFWGLKRCILLVEEVVEMWLEKEKLPNSLRVTKLLKYLSSWVT